MRIVGVKENFDNNDNSNTVLKIFIHQGEKLLYYDYHTLESPALRKVANVNKELRDIVYLFHFDSLVSWNPAEAKEKRKRRNSAEDSQLETIFPLKTTRDYNRPIANNYIELCNRKILRKCR
ncbi:hypothetical protein IFM89_006718 [Coptis chinensis]|uniref:Uncharacterized protein n=1 Tax=Coptis chinensis TaxID=261450 RepID=A0A835LKM3_9MAGN|nr:hypothetical protein IFM89_006718 [Coptis chinensis]